MKIKFIDHVVVFVSNLRRTETFYSSFLGKPSSKNKYQVAYKIGNTKLFLALPYRKKAKMFDKQNIGLNHIAFGVVTIKELKSFLALLNKAKIKNSGIKIDKYGKKEFIWFDDPDGIRLELYLRN